MVLRTSGMSTQCVSPTSRKWKNQMKSYQQKLTSLAQQFIASKKLRNASSLAYTKCKNEIIESLSTVSESTKEIAIEENRLATFMEPAYGLFSVTGTYMKPGLRLNKQLLIINLAKHGLSATEIENLIEDSSKCASPRLELVVEQTRRAYDKEESIIDKEINREYSLDTQTKKAG